MSDLEKDKRHSTSVITDLRNFSKTFKDYQNANDEKFLDFIGEYYSVLNTLATTISDKVWMHSIGDGILSIFLDEEDHDKKGYAYILSAHRVLNNMCSKFIEDNPGTHISFGIGADSGNVWKVGEGHLNTYVGTVINRAARIEALTKGFGKATTAIGNSLYLSLLRDFYPSVLTLVEEAEDYDTLLDESPETVLVSKKFMLHYAYDIPLKGIQASAPIFRLSDSLALNDKLFWSVIDKLVGEEKKEQIKNIIG